MRCDGSSSTVTPVCVQSLCGMLGQASRLMIKDAMASSSLSDDKRRFMVAWGRLIDATAAWMSAQLHAGILTPADIVGVANTTIEAARTYLADRDKTSA